MCINCKVQLIPINLLQTTLLHLFSFKTPTLWAVMSGDGVAYCASSMRNGVKLFCFQVAYIICGVKRKKREGSIQNHFLCKI